jgi:hypothetical protein
MLYCVYFCVVVLITAAVLRRKLTADGRPTERYVVIMVALAGAGGLVTLIAGAIGSMVLYWPDKDPGELAGYILVGMIFAGPALGAAATLWWVFHTSPRRLIEAQKLAADYDEPEPPGHNDHPAPSP